MSKKWIASLLSLAILAVVGFVLIITLVLSGVSQEEVYDPLAEEKKEAAEHNAKPDNEKDTELTGNGEKLDSEEDLLEGDNSITSESEWEVMKLQAYEMLMVGQFGGAVEHLMYANQNLDTNNKHLEDQVFNFEQDVTILESLSGRNSRFGSGLTPSESMSLAKKMRDPVLSLIAMFTLSHEERVQTLMNQNSLAPVIENFPTYGELSDYKGAYLNDIQHFYGKSAEPKRLDFTIENGDMYAVLIKIDNEWKVYGLFEVVEGSTNYQNVKYWKDYFSKIRK